MGSHLVRCDTVAYERNVDTGQREDRSCLGGVGVWGKLLLVDQQNRDPTGLIRTGEGGGVSVVQDKGPTRCQLREILICTILTWLMPLLLLLLQLSLWVLALRCVEREVSRTSCCGGDGWGRSKEISEGVIVRKGVHVPERDKDSEYRYCRPKPEATPR